MFGPFVTSIVAFSFAGKPAGRSYRWATLLTSKNANRRSQTSLLLSYDCAELASLDSNCPLAIPRRFLQRAYFLECEPEASFLLSKVSYSYILILVALLLTLRLFPGSSLSADLRTWRHFSLRIQESPTTLQLRSVDFNQSLEPVRTVPDLHRGLQLRRQARSSFISLGHSLDVRKCESEITNILITILRPCRARVFGFKLFFGHSAPLPAAGLFPRMRARSIVFIV